MVATCSTRYVLHSTPRTASSALMRILNVKDQPNNTTQDKEGYFLLPLFYHFHLSGLSLKHPSTWTEDERLKLKALATDSFKTMEEFLRTAESHGHNVYIKEHSDFLTDPSVLSTFVNQGPGTEDIQDVRYMLREDLTNITSGHRTWSATNLTLFPDEYLATWRPTFLLRHPGLSFPSQYRAFRDLDALRDAISFKTHHGWTLTLNLKWARALYDLYANVVLKDAPKANDGVTSWPIILNSAEILSSPTLMQKYCSLVGFEEEKLKFSWDLAREGDRLMSSQMSRRMTSTLNASKGIMAEKVIVDVDLDAEAIKWRQEFGDEDGRFVEILVRNAMPDYEFLMERRLQI